MSSTLKISPSLISSTVLAKRGAQNQSMVARAVFVNLKTLFNKYDWGRFQHGFMAEYPDNSLTNGSPMKAVLNDDLPGTITKRSTRRPIHSVLDAPDDYDVLMSGLCSESPYSSSSNADYYQNTSAEKENNPLPSTSATPLHVESYSATVFSSSPILKDEYDFLDEINSSSNGSRLDSSSGQSVESAGADNLSDFIADSDSDSDARSLSDQDSVSLSSSCSPGSDSDEEGLDEGILQYSPPRPPKRVSKGIRLPSSDTPYIAVDNDSQPLSLKKKVKGDISEKDFFKNRIQYTQTVYEEFNAAAFGNRLPRDLSVSWHKRMLTTAGRAWLKLSPEGNRIANIELSEKVIDSIERLRSTLLHEMCHVAAWILSSERKPPHGPKFWYWAKVVEKSLSMPVSRCHSYNIHKPHRFECMTCKHSYMRHSKSIDTDTQVCGSCRGRLVYSGNFNKDGTPKKQRAPTAFSIFVKENFANVKKKNTGQSHAETMQELSKMFKSSMAI
jgi:predicted SprT family Zn-dependent metalloprotease